MKRSLAAILVASLLAVNLTACSDNKIGSGEFEPDDISIATTAREDLPKFDLDTLPRVDKTESFGEYRVDSFDKAWGADKNLRMAYTTVRNYFNYYALDSRNNQVNTNLNYISTISRPNITVYPAEEEGYVVYEVKYTQLFPVYTQQPATTSYSFFSYHGVSYMDYYTGTTFPVVNLSTQIDSFCVTGDVIYNGKTYHVSYYEYREQELLDNASHTEEDGTVIIRETMQLHSTAYFVVPEGYDGIIMCVYVANDMNTPVDEVLAEDSPYFEEPGYFGDDENVDDYVFFGITPPK